MLAGLAVPPKGLRGGRNLMSLGASRTAVTAMGDRLKAKVCLVGEAAVGKTRLVQRTGLADYADRSVQPWGTKGTKRRRPGNPGTGGGPAAADPPAWDAWG